MNKQFLDTLTEQCYHRYSERNIDLDQFADSIIRKVADLVDQEWNISGAAIKEHFGVEE
jgi:hypothetical protein